MTQVRIGDTERDAAAAALGEHYAAGRLTKEEYDERIDRVWAAKYEDDLAPLFGDLPRRSTLATAARGAASATGTGRSRPVRRPGPANFHPLMLLGPIIVAGIIAAAVVAGASWLFLLFLLWCFGGMGRRRNHHWAHSR